jgi:ketosteroid isomerase-like protein
MKVLLKLALVCVTSAWAVGLSHAAENKPRASDDEAQIKALFADLMKAIMAQDTKAVVSHYAPRGFMYIDVSLPRAYYGIEGATFTWDAYFGLVVPGSVKAEATDLHVTVAGDGKYAFAYHFDHYQDQLKQPSPALGHLLDFTNRATSFLEKIDGRWYIKLEHNSFPLDLATGKADWKSTDVRQLPAH